MWDALKSLLGSIHCISPVPKSAHCPTQALQQGPHATHTGSSEHSLRLSLQWLRSFHPPGRLDAVFWVELPLVHGALCSSLPGSQANFRMCSCTPVSQECIAGRPKRSAAHLDVALRPNQLSLTSCGWARGTNAHSGERCMLSVACPLPQYSTIQCNAMQRRYADEKCLLTHPHVLRSSSEAAMGR